jgi:4-amino-4-deoxy-L-arabinose transferase-like glycosyltransferase
MIQKYFSAFILTAIFSFFFINLDGGRPFANPDEGRYVEIPREMVKSGDYITPRLNAMKYFEKPPLMYWVQSAVIKYIGMDEQNMRLSIALFAFFGVFSLYILMRKNTDEKTALYSSIILALSPLYYFLSRLIILDMPLTAFISFSYLCFYQAVMTDNRFHKRLWYYGLSTALGLGMLTKGIVILAVTGPVFLIWLTITQNWQKLLPIFLPTVIILFLAIVVPWHYLAHKANPDFLNKYFYVEHFLRYTTSVHGRYKPFWFFIPFVVFGLIPWTFMAIKGMQMGLKKYKPLTLYLALWALWTVGFYSIGNSKLIPYILPALIPIAGLAGIGLNELMTIKRKHWSLVVGAVIMAVLGCIALLAVYFFRDLFQDCTEIIPYAILSSILFLGCGAGAAIRKEFKLCITLLCSCSIILIVLTNLIAPSIQKTSVKPFAEIINAEKRVGDAIVSFDSYFQDLPVYTQTAPIICVEAISELEYGMNEEAPKTYEWMLTKARFMLEFGPGSGKSFWAVARKTAYEDFKQQVPDWNLTIKSQNKELVLFYHNGK